jgi:high-affinity nickel permease
MSFLTLTSSALALGFVHGLGADHLMAIAALATDRRNGQTRARIMRTAVGFAVGHMVVLGLGVTAAVVFGLVLPAAFASGAERLGGVLLIALGTLGLWGVISGRAYSHLHQEVGGRARWHFHFGGHHHPHGHSRIPTVLGAVFALSSLRALMLLEPFGASAQTLALPMLLLLNILFGLGILLAMSLFGVLLARLLSFGTIDTIGRVAAAGVALASILLGVYWMA